MIQLLRLVRKPAVSYLVALTAAAVVGVAVHPTEAGPKEDFAALEMQMEFATEGFAAAMRAVRSSGGAPGQGHEGTPVDLRPQILQRMDTLVAGAAESPDGAEVATKTLRWSLELRDAGSLDRFRSVAARYPDTPELAEVLEAVQYVHDWSKPAQDWTVPLSKLAEATQRPQNRIRAYYAVGQIHLWTKGLRDAKAAFERILEQSPESELAKAAQTCLFEIENLQVGMTAPDFTATTMDGRQVSLKSLRGKVILLNFWGTFCPTCIVEIPRLQAVVAKFAGRPFEILSVSCDDDRNVAQRMINRRKPPGIQTWDEGGRANPAAVLYNVLMFPTWYVIDAQGIIRSRDPFGEALTPAIESAF